MGISVSAGSSPEAGWEGLDLFDQKMGESPNGEENGAVLECPAGNNLGFIPHGTQFILGRLLVNSARAVS